MFKKIDLKFIIFLIIVCSLSIGDVLFNEHKQEILNFINYSLE